LPALAGAIVTSRGLVEIGAIGVRKAGTNVPVTTDDLWHLGSDTKAMTAVVIGWLVERGKLNWETTIAQVFPELASTLPQNFANITVLELLSHHAGLPANIDWHAVSQSGSLREQRLLALKTAATMKLLSEPGTKFEYSNLGYVIAAALAERVTNESWEQLISRIVFKPLGMKSAGFGGTGTLGEIDQPWPHTSDGKPTANNGPRVDNPEVMGPAGTVHCSLSDWAKFISDQLRGERTERALLKPWTYKKLHTPPFGGDYALGWGIAQRGWGGGTVLTHAGSNTMNFAVVWIAPARDFAVLITTNEGGPDAEKGCDEAASALINLYLKR
ncbi:MAG TPA: serine hydrolase domain-containing protein, partial [Pyrinomonadaceae bacterium]|nr:serine hydrolase domain-containing protein [Pyrinomonadaceae bacterium]